MAVVRWIFEDPTVPESYTFEINPSDGGSPSYAKTLNYQATAGPGGKTLVFEGRDEVAKLEWSGVILTQAHLDVLLTWYEKRRQIKVTDDLGRVFWIYITAYSPKRKRAATRPWKHEYSMSALILSWA